MKLYTTIRVDMNEHEILAQPGIMARLRKALGGNPDLSTGRMRAVLEAGALVDSLRRALAELGANDAVSLVVDDVVLFEDRDRKPDDLGDMFLAFHDYAPALAELKLMRLTVEHREAGVHYVIELQARPEYPKGEAPVRAIISARVGAFEPTPGESAEAYRARVEPLVNDGMTFKVAQLSFDDFCGRARDAIARALPDARVSFVTSQPAPIKPRQNRVPRPEDPDYDPHERYYPNPMLGMFAMSMMGMAMFPAFGAMGMMGGMGDVAPEPADLAPELDVGSAVDDVGGFDFEW
jgi:hypothetical protein